MTWRNDRKLLVDRAIIYLVGILPSKPSPMETCKTVRHRGRSSHE